MVLTLVVRRVCNFLGSVSSQQKFEVIDQRYSPWTDRVTTLGQINVQVRVTAQFNLENKGKYILEVLGHANPKDMKKRERERMSMCTQERETDPKDVKKRERECTPARESAERESAHVRESGRERERDPWPFGSYFYVFFFFFFPPPLGLPYVNWASQECCLFYLTSSLRPWVFLCSIFAGFSVPCLLATAILDSFFLF